MAIKKETRLFVTFLLLVLGVVLVRTAWVCDDAYFTFRTVDNFVHGHGLTWNIGERVQGFTHPLWMLLFSLFYFFTREAYFTVLLISVILTFAAVSIFAFKLAKDTPGAVVGIAVLIFSKAFIDYATSGLENPLSYFLVALFFLILLRYERGRGRIFVLFLIASLLALNRLDLALLVLPCLLYVLWQERGLRCLSAAAAGLVPLAIWEVFSIIYFGFPFPNTYYAKLHTGVPEAALAEQGLLYVMNSLLWDPLTLLAIGWATLVAFVSGSRRAIASMLGVILYTLYVVAVGGCFMSGRFFSVPLFVAVIIIASSPYRLLFSQWRYALAAVVVIGISSPRNPFLSGSDYGSSSPREIEKTGLCDERAYYFKDMGLLNLRRDFGVSACEAAKEGLALELGDQRVVSSRTSGVVSYFAGPRIYFIDVWGLCEPLLARIPLADGAGWRIGHFQRPVPDGYKQTIETGENAIKDLRLRAFYDRLSMIVKGDIFSRQRFGDIWRMNTGRYDSLIEAFRCLGPELAYTDVCQPKGKGTLWETEGNVVLGALGATIRMGEVRHCRRVEVSVDDNDSYEFAYYLDTTLLARQVAGKRAIEGGGLRIDTLSVPEKAASAGYDVIKIEPVEGDGRYSVGHVRLLDTE